MTADNISSDRLYTKGLLTDDLHPSHLTFEGCDKWMFHQLRVEIVVPNRYELLLAESGSCQIAHNTILPMMSIVKRVAWCSMRNSSLLTACLCRI